jgi:hypothetical protein
MSPLASVLPTRRPELIIRPLGERGRYVVKDPGNGSYFQLGEQEHFLLLQLSGDRAAGEVCRAFEERFAEPLSAEDLDGFSLGPTEGLLESAEARVRSWNDSVPPAASTAPRLPRSAAEAKPPLLAQNLIDPIASALLEPKIRFFWTRAFLTVSAACIVLALFVLATSGSQIVSSFARGLRWETLLLAWLTLLVVTTLHEFAHGLTCKHYGGEVHEIGFLLMYFLPCFYCNVSDAWLFREKSKRLWVTFAGGYFEAFLWALAVFVGG